MINKILHVLHSLNLGGAEVMVTQLIHDLGEKYEMGVCCLDEKGDLGVQLEKEGIPIFNLSRIPGNIFNTYYNLRRCLRKFNPDLIHAHQYTPFFFTALAKTRGCRLIFTEQGRHYPDWVGSRRRWCNRWLQHRADRIIAVCQATRRSLIKNEGITNSQIDVIYNGARFEGIDYGNPLQLRKELGIPLEAKVIGFVGRLHPIKNPQLLLHAFASAAGRNSELRLVFIGDGELRQEMIAEISRKQLSDKVIFAGSQHPVYPYLKILDLFVLPSLSEGSSLTLLEAMAAGIPVVATRVGGNPEFVDNNRTGVLIPSGDEAQLCQVIMEFAEQPERFTSLAEQARKMVEMKYSVKEMVRQYQDLYEKLS